MLDLNNSVNNNIPNSINQNIVSTKNHNHVMDDKTLSDYIKFFTTEEGADMLPYAYIDDDNAYDNLVKNNKDYYPFYDEVALIKNNSKSLTKYLSDIDDIIEIGPGSEFVTENKTIPIINYAKNLKNYIALDHSEIYLNKISKFIRSKASNVNISTVKADFTNIDESKFSNHNNKKCVLFLGSTLGNFNDKDQNNVLQQINKICNKGDLFILSMDTNQDEKLLFHAYNGQSNNNFAYNIIEHFLNVSFDFNRFKYYFYIDALWNDKKKLVNTYFTSKISFYLCNYGMVNIIKGQRLNGIIFRKIQEEETKNSLAINNFKLLDILDNSGKMKMFICKRI